MENRYCDKTNKRAKRTAIAIDVDGTLFSLQEVHTKIMNEIFGNNVFVKKTNTIVWWIANLDVFPNSMLFLEVIFLLYSFADKLSYKEIYQKYGMLYRKYSQEFLEEHIASLRQLKDKGFEPIIVSNNLFSKGMRIGEFETIAEGNKSKLIHELRESADIAYVVGNNLSDDIILAHKIGARAVYVGKSPIVQKYNGKKKCGLNLSFNKFCEFVESER